MRNVSAQILGVGIDEYNRSKTYFENEVDLSLGGGNKVETTFDDGKIKIQMQTSDALDDIDEKMLREFVLDQVLKMSVAAFNFETKVSVETPD